MAGSRETEYLKPIDKAFFREVNELPGRNESERRGGLVKEKPRRPSPQVKGEGSMGGRKLNVTIIHFGGVVATAR